MKLLAILVVSAMLCLSANAQSSGLRYKYYEGTWTSIPNFATLTPSKSGSSTNLDLGIRNRDMQYAILWQGNIRITASGDYTFETVSDDGSKLFIDNSDVELVNNDGVHTSQTRSGTTYLNAGIYPISISYLQSTGDATMEVYWSSNTGLPRQKIPNASFTSATTDPAVSPAPSGLTGIHNYYVSTSTGDDSRTSAQAQNSSTPWKTLAKINSYFSSLLPGDAVLLNRGDVFQGPLIVSASGTSGSPIIISAYGSGNKPLISGMSTLSGWSSVGGGIYQTNCPSCNPGLNTVTINNSIKAKGRFPNASAPNKGYLTFESHSGTNMITDNELSSSPNYQGGELVIRNEAWEIDADPITAHSGNTITFTPQSTYPPKDGYGYFIQNHPSTLDQFGEWYFNASSKDLQVYLGSSPDSYSVNAGTVDTVVNLNRKNYITISNIAVNGANLSAMQVDNTIGVTIQYCDITNSGADAINGEKTTNIQLLYNNISSSLNNGIILVYYASGAVLRGNIIKSSGTMAGMNKSGDGKGCGIQLYLGKDNLIENNEVDSSGYVGIGFYCDSIIVRNNFVNYFDLTKQDGGGIYSCARNVGDENNKSGKVIIGNIVLNGIGTSEGTNNPTYIASDGIYIDDRNSEVQIIDNTVANCAQSGMYIHNSHELNIKGNTLFNNKSQILMGHDNIASDNPIRNNVLKNNVIYANAPGQYLGTFRSPDHDVAEFGTLDSNYYCKAVDTINAFSTLMSGEVTNLSFSGWKSTYSQYDLNSTVTNINASRFEYNASASSRTIQLDTTYVDAKSNRYSGSLTLAPYTSLILTKTADLPAGSGPIAKAGNDVYMTLPINSVTLNGTGSTDKSGSIATYSWTKIAGPDQVALTNTTTAKPVMRNMVEGTYALSLYVTNNSGTGAYDTVFVSVKAEQNTTTTTETTEVTSTPEHKPVVTELSLTVYPNPVAGQLNTKFTSQKDGKLTVNIYDASGKMIRSNAFEKQGATFEKTLDVATLHSGVYYLKLTSDDGAAMVKPFVKN